MKLKEYTELNTLNLEPSIVNPLPQTAPNHYPFSPLLNHLKLQ